MTQGGSVVENCEAMLNNYTAIVDFLNYEIEEQANKDVAQAMGN